VNLISDICLDIRMTL